MNPVEPLVPTLGRDEARKKLWRPALEDAGRPLPSPRWFSSEDFLAWLNGRSVGVGGPEEALAMTRRPQVHVGILPEKLTADEGVLFSHDVIETLELDAEWAIGVEVMLPDGELSAVATLGSDARLARVESLPGIVFEPPAQVVESFRATSIGLRIVAVTHLSCQRRRRAAGMRRP